MVQVALLLDTSNSMDGLIDQARSQLWKVVNQFALAHRDGRPADLEVALYEYGNNGLEASDGYIGQVSAFTTDLDLVSEKLFALTTNGGEEYCGQVIDTAVSALSWSPRGDALKAIFIAGNEPFTQGSHDPEMASRRALAAGITVSTIHCGPRGTGIASGWEKGALLAHGSFMSIDQDRAVAHITAPQDDEIARLGEAMNRTYVPFGEAGAQGYSRQSAQDGNAATAGKGSRVQRGLAKASRHYKNAKWDLVDAVDEGTVDLAKLKTEALPEAMKALNAEQQKQYLSDKALERARLKARIQQLNLARGEYVARAQVEQAGLEDATLDVALIESLREQAKRKLLTLE
jgi:hypothetical protein